MPPQDDISTRRLFFIASYPRSGNTWVRAFLYFLLQEGGYVKTDISLSQMDEYMPWDISRRYVEPVLRKKIAAATTEELAAARGAVHRLLAGRMSVVPIVKTHALFGTYLGHPTFDMRVYGGSFYLVRNPLDVVSSLARHFGRSVDDAVSMMGNRLHIMKSGSGIGGEPWGDWSFNVHSWTEVGPRRALVTRYEDLLADPLSGFEAMVAHLGLVATAGQLARAASRVGLDQLETLERREGFRSRPSESAQFFGGGARRSFRDKITSAQARSLIEQHAVRMNTFGYLTDEALQFAGIEREAALARSREFLPEPT